MWPDFAQEPRLLHMLDETARRYGQTPARWVSSPTDDPVTGQWFDLLLSRACAGAAVESQRQWLQRNGEHVMWVMPAPGS